MGLNSSGRKRKTERSVGASEEALAVSMPIGEASAPPPLLRSPDRMDGHVQKRPYLARLGVQHRDVVERSDPRSASNLWLGLPPPLTERRDASTDL
jgi:hypothetical protein